MALGKDRTAHTVMEKQKPLLRDPQTDALRSIKQESLKVEIDRYEKKLEDGDIPLLSHVESLHVLDESQRRIQELLHTARASGEVC